MFNIRQSREALFKIIFESEMRDEDPLKIYEEYKEREDSISHDEALDFMEKYALGISDERVENTIRDEMTEWDIERIGKVEKVLLKMATYELLLTDTPYEIVINEAIEISKIYGDSKAPTFINGVLAKIVKKYKN